MTVKRITREIADLKKEDLGPIVLEPSDNLSIWKGSIPGPQGSVYEGGIFNVEIVLPTDYPYAARFPQTPKVMFKTRIYHMNISEQGNICIDILKQNWSPALSLFKVMLSLSSLLTDPNPKDPLVPSIAMQYLRNRKEHDATARQWTNSFACPKPPPPAVVQPPPPRTTKGKKRADAGSSGASGSSSSVSRSARSGANATTSTSIAEVIELDSDSEDDTTNRSDPKGKKRKRPSGSGPTNAEEVVDLSDEEAAAAAPKKTRTRNPPSRTDRSSNSARSSRQLGEVIVIDDDDGN
ncbi:hypothetical protein CVT25_012457 [Psilocybe cyanescens]|uniref:UBC core domain-containing protein n=1 Tax=Psilocybe cyanescens TaxID=93625 RepID=A0A409XHC2_PSICY|nr:hypothetical protein CVT25_012457 [Psilocybe cyanescens]